MTPYIPIYTPFTPLANAEVIAHPLNIYLSQNPPTGAMVAEVTDGDPRSFEGIGRKVTVLRPKPKRDVGPKIPKTMIWNVLVDPLGAPGFNRRRVGQIGIGSVLS